MANAFDGFAQRRSTAARWILAAATLAAIILPAAIVLAILAGHTVAALAGVLACSLLYPIGYRTAALRYGQRLREQVAAARRDALTGLPTRAVVDDVLDDATRHGIPVAVALADVDGLKPVNANLGHAAGDQYLRSIARRLAAAVPPGGTLARQGGDEFCLVAPHTDPAALAVRIGAAMAGPAVIGGYRIQPRASVGVAATAGGDAFYARACADAAMYAAKAAGGNHILVYGPDRDGRPQPDGTRPLVRRRDLDPLGRGGFAWRPARGDTLLPVLWSPAEARSVHQALLIARDRWAEALAQAAAGATATPRQRPETPDQVNIETTPAGYQTISDIAARQRARYATLADRLARLLDAAQPDDIDSDDVA